MVWMVSVHAIIKHLIMMGEVTFRTTSHATHVAILTSNNFQTKLLQDLFTTSHLVKHLEKTS